ncbi:gsr2076 [Gloeobacter violaceus PCC 7421]|uniref:Gsr2076 protein n=2 Tax=Gloeobacter violaceus TaxID=33072 RepID=Q7NIV6_GLOVI|nr:gsr2076 [Gloeobacter violaceus PCC 7421]
MKARHGKSGTMAKESVTFRVEAGLLASVDELARLFERDRSWVLNEAIRVYIREQQAQLERLDEGIAQAERGEFATQPQIDELFRQIRALP